MKTAEEIYEMIKELVSSCLPDLIDLSDDGSYLSIHNTGIWITADFREIIIGYDTTHSHFGPEYYELVEAIDLFFDLLTCRKQITHFFKGNFSYKYRTDLILNNNELYFLGTSMTWFYPFWKKTVTKIIVYDAIIDFKGIEKEINEIKKLCA